MTLLLRLCALRIRVTHHSECDVFVHEPDFLCYEPDVHRTTVNGRQFIKRATGDGHVFKMGDDDKCITMKYSWK